MVNRARILYVYKLLYQKTDEQNPLTTVQIINYLSDIGIKAHRLTILQQQVRLLLQLPLRW